MSEKEQPREIVVDDRLALAELVEKADELARLLHASFFTDFESASMCAADMAAELERGRNTMSDSQPWVVVSDSGDNILIPQFRQEVSEDGATGVIVSEGLRYSHMLERGRLERFEASLTEKSIGGIKEYTPDICAIVRLESIEMKPNPWSKMTADRSAVVRMGTTAQIFSEEHYQEEAYESAIDTLEKAGSTESDDYSVADYIDYTDLLPDLFLQQETGKWHAFEGIDLLKAAAYQGVQLLEKPEFKAPRIKHSVMEVMRTKIPLFRRLVTVRASDILYTTPAISLEHGQNFTVVQEESLVSGTWMDVVESVPVHPIVDAMNPCAVLNCRMSDGTKRVYYVPIATLSTLDYFY